MLKGIHIASKLSHYLHVTGSLKLSFHEIGQYVTKSLDESFDLSIATCIKEEGKQFVWLSKHAPSWTDGDLSPINITSSTRKVVLLGTESSDVASQCISIADSGALPKICTLIPLSMTNDAVIILICSAKEGNFKFPMTRRLASLLHGLITPVLGGFYSIKESHLSQRAANMSAIMKRREHLIVRKALSTMKSVMTRRLLDRLGETTIRLNKLSSFVSSAE